MIIALMAILGLVLGSFANAVTWRLKSGESITHGRSMCPECKHQLAARDLVPVLSWLSSKGKCRYCKKPISIQYPVVELLTALIFGLSVWLLPSLGVVMLGLWLTIIVCLMILGAYDARWYELPNKVMHPALILAFIYYVLHFEPASGFFQLIVALIAAAIFYALWRLSDGRLMGGADSKLVLLMGLILPPALLGLAIGLGFMLGGVGAAVLLVRKQKGMHDQMPFGPYLIAGLIIAQLFGAQLLHLLGF
jgi:leader peptidase (prepilin peptidase)/N-methyltransferase